MNNLNQRAISLTTTCPGCGARLPDEITCQDIFDAFLVLEFTDPGYGAVHFLTVACFMIQHGRYSDAGLTWIEQKLRAHLEQGLPVDQIRQQANRDADQSKRAWKVTRPPDAPPLPKIPWSLTIAAVAPGYPLSAPAPEPALYQQRVQQWARITLREMQVWLK